MKHRRSSRVSSVLGWVAVGGIVVMSASLYMGAMAGGAIFFLMLAAEAVRMLVLDAVPAFVDELRRYLVWRRSQEGS
jgi:hypothetical protein